MFTSAMKETCRKKIYTSMIDQKKESNEKCKRSSNRSKEERERAGGVSVDQMEKKKKFNREKRLSQRKD